MKNIIAFLLWAPMLASAACGWDQPGKDRYIGDAATAINHYQDIAAPIRKRLIQRIEHDPAHYDDVALITRDSIKGSSDYEPELKQMFFGNGRICATPGRRKWASIHQERALIYCDSGHCIAVPTVCGNISRIQKRPHLHHESISSVASNDEYAGGPGTPNTVTFVGLAEPYYSTVSSSQFAANPTIQDEHQNWSTSPMLSTGSIIGGDLVIEHTTTIQPKPCDCLPPPCVHAIPEPRIFEMFCIGGIIVAFKIKRKKNESV